MHNEYLMESEEEAVRLDLKTDRASVHKQALWAGIKPGFRVADIGCGSGKTTAFLQELVAPGGGMALGLDGSAERIEHARRTYSGSGLCFCCRDFYQPLDDLGPFDFIWVRFVLEYHRTHAREIVERLTRILAPGGILCLIDLDHNCLNHFGAPPRLTDAICRIMQILEETADFDPFAGRKLYSYLFDQGYQSIDVCMAAHHLIFGQLNQVDGFNWRKKVGVSVRHSGFDFAGYEGGYAEFFEEFQSYFQDPRRFVDTPLIACRGVKPG
jgi:SAM-dependent methyltransferase